MLPVPNNQGVSGDGGAPNAAHILETGARPPDELGTEMCDRSWALSLFKAGDDYLTPVQH